MQVVDDHHSRSRTHSHAHAPSEAAAAEAGAVTDAAQLPKRLPGESGMSNNFQVNNERPLEQLPVDHEKAGHTISSFRGIQEMLMWHRRTLSSFLLHQPSQ